MLPIIQKLWIHMPHAFSHNRGNRRKMRVWIQTLTPKKDGPPDDAPQHIAPAPIARYHPVADQKGCGPGVLDDYSYGVVGSLVRAVSLAG